MERKEIFSSAKKVVVKIGSAVLADEEKLNLKILRSFCQQLAFLQKKNNLSFVLVSSGAVAAGRAKLKNKKIKGSLTEKQALAAVGQGRLMQAYEEAFAEFNIPVAQVLLTRPGLLDRQKYLNVKNTLQTLLDWKIIPIINENDTVSTEELQFTDNDTLAALVLNLVKADLFICLSDIDCLYDKDPKKFKEAKPIKVVEKIDARILKMASKEAGRAGRGGMKSKLFAAQIATLTGVSAVIAKGREKDILKRLFQGEELGTLFLPQKKRFFGKRPWIALILERKGKLYLDEGAVKAILEQGKSLLPVGIKQVEGEFRVGDSVVCLTPTGEEIAVGLVNYSSIELLKIKGCASAQISQKLNFNKNKIPEAIHRDNLVVLK